MVEERVLRIRRSDAAAGDFVLVHLKPNGSSALDLALTGTDGESPFATTLKSHKIVKLKATNSSQDDAIWHLCLSFLLLGQQPDDPSQQNHLDGIELLASVKPETTLTLSVRQELSGITRTFGSVSLPYSPETEIGLFDWTALSTLSCNELSSKVETLTSTVADQDGALKRLQAQLDELIEAKKQHEDEILEKCRQLLNTKKLKIRDQQRLLAGAKFSASAAKDVREARAASGGASHRAMPSRPAKRKANREPSPNSLKDESEGEETEVEGVKTPESDRHEQSDDDDEGTFDAVKSPVPKKEPQSQTNLPPQAASPTSNSNPQANVSSSMDVDDEETDDEL
ncbi:MAG: hypothetical protein M1828_003110 [Chrysothrix sp. TS-e1954]|nr:MAG: hypothetical protein M1828_003110 [Chrysothrix sp. TS-e1954]